MSVASLMTFTESIQLAIDVVPGLRNDFKLIAKRRQNKARDMEGLGRVGLNIPDPVRGLLQQYHPELYQEDVELQNRAWLTFMKHPDSKLFRVNLAL